VRRKDASRRGQCPVIEVRERKHGGRCCPSASAAEKRGIAQRPVAALLSVLNMAGRPLRVGEIADRMQVVGPHVTRLINTLEQRGLVRRVTDPSDQRARLIEPTPEGASAIGRYLQAVFGWFTAAMSDWPQQDRRDLGSSSRGLSTISPPTRPRSEERQFALSSRNLTVQTVDFTVMICPKS
jgi:DNA-binding MarR family transcriptional regulator